MPATTGRNRLFGPATQGRIQELRRQASVAISEVTEEATAAGDFPRRVSVLRREASAPGQSSVGIRATWVTVAGLDNLVAHVRTHGTWRDETAGVNTVIKAAERVVLISDIPAGGEGEAYELMPTDRLSWDDPVFGDGAVFDVTEMRVRKADGLIVALTRYAREG